MFIEFLYKSWRAFNEFQQQDYLFLICFKLVNEMMILDKDLQITHGDLKNEATENLHSVMNLIFDRALKRDQRYISQLQICSSPYMALHSPQVTIFFNF